MAEIIPLDQLPILDPHELQQVLLERDESIERLDQINSLTQSLADSDAEIQDLHKQITDLTINNTSLITAITAITDALGSAAGTPGFIEAQKQRAIAEKKRLEELLAEKQAIIDQA